MTPLEAWRAEQREDQWLASDYEAAAFYAAGIPDPISLLSEYVGRHPLGAPFEVRTVLAHAQHRRNRAASFHGRRPTDPRKATA